MRVDDSELKDALAQIEQKYGSEARTKVNEIISDALRKDQPLTHYEVMYVAELLIRGQDNCY